MVKAAREARTSEARTTVDPAEVARFAGLADEWWNPHGKMRPLHKFNPVRLAYIRDRICERFGRDAKSLESLKGLRILDVRWRGSALKSSASTRASRMSRRHGCTPKKATLRSTTAQQPRRRWPTRASDSMSCWRSKWSST
jgi:hypothetical protein